uniref:Acyl-coenzyme A oxidase n=1 Tax=Ursus maritimus TaxID=29073 RepID=A0A452TZL2_URSMA
MDLGTPYLPKGPLQAYRARASFCWQELALFLEGEDVLRLKKAIFSALENDPLFARPHGEDLSLEKYRELNFLRCKRAMEYNLLPVESIVANPLLVQTLITCLGMYDWSLAIKLHLHMLVTIYSSGSERHLKYLPKIFNMEIFGCFAVTELSHGSNAKAIRTTAHYDPTTEEFIIHSPDFEAAKFWIGNMGKTATHAVVFAQLYTPGGQCHGLHAFMVQIRNPKTLLPMPGVMVGDMGKKLGLNGMDNGFAMFHKVRVPRQDLLNRTGDVTPEGTYVTPFKDDRQRFGATLGTLSIGRVVIMGMSTANLKLAVSIALRFSATRCQFGPSDVEEVPVLEYQMQQWRLLPYLAAAYALDHFSKSLFLDLAELQQGLMGADQSTRQAELGREIHALASAGKPLASWITQRGIAEDMAIWPVGFEACDGFLSIALLLTRVFANKVLLEHGHTHSFMNFLWPCLHDNQGGARFESPLKTVDFLEAYPDILGQRFTCPSVNSCLDSSVPLAAYEWLVCYLLRESYQKFNQEKRSGSNDFEARNNSQVYYCRPLALAFLELTVVRKFHEYTHQRSVPPPLRAVLGRLGALYALWSLSQHTALLYQGGYFAGEQAGKMIQSAILDLCSQLKDDAVALVDVIAPPDFVLDSPIGRADGELYKNLWTAVLLESKVLERPSWWSEFSVNKPHVGSLKSKL